MKFPSKIEVWLAVTLSGSAFVSLWASHLLAGGNSLSALLISAVVLAIGAGLPLWLLLSTHYQVEGHILKIFSGPFRWRIRISQITHITPSRSVMSSPALSPDRLRITHGGGKVVLISPRDRDSFLTAMGWAGRAA